MGFVTSISMEDAEAQMMAIFQGVEAALPPGSNPVPALQAILANEVHPSSGNGFRIQLYILAGILGLCPFLLLASLVVKWQRNNLWFFRIGQHRGGSLLIPHYSSTWTITLAVGLACMQGYIWSTVDYIHDSTVTGIILWKTITWIVSHALHLAASGRDSGRFYASASFLNIIGVMVPVSLFAIIIPLSVTTANKYNHSVSTYNALDELLNTVSSNWNGTLTNSEIQEATVLGATMLIDFDVFITYFRSVFLVYCVFGFCKDVTFAIVASRHIRSLRQTLEETKVGQHRNTLPTAQEKLIHKRYVSLVQLTIALSVVAQVYQGVFLHTSINSDANKIIQDGTSNEAASLLGLYSFSAMSIPLSLYLFRRAFDQTTVSNSEGVASATGSNPTNELVEVKAWEASPQSHETERLSFGSSQGMFSAASPMEMGDRNQDVAAPYSPYGTYPARTAASPADSNSTYKSSTSKNSKGWF
ncbi:hypothetical protein MNV49_006789 [Pseudohyphozyma bogoriensis]|nr:hypothetical protein MNV49_006789 [Pseudohyphozyma bogoriensis]